MHLQFTQPVASVQSPHNFQCSSPFGKRLHQGAHIFDKCWSHLKIPGARWVTWTRFRTQDAQLVGATVQSSVARATWRAVFVRPWCLSWRCVTSSLAFTPRSLLETKQVCGKFVAVHRESPQTAHRSVWTCVSGCFFLPAVHNYTSQQLAVQMFNFADYSCRDHCSTGVPFGEHNCSC